MVVIKKTIKSSSWFISRIKTLYDAQFNWFDYNKTMGGYMAIKEITFIYKKVKLKKLKIITIFLGGGPQML